MKQALIVILSILFFPSHGQSLVFTINNKTGYDVDSLRLCPGQFFSLKAGEQVVITTCRPVSMQGGIPWGRPGGVIYGRKKNNSTLRSCGTGITSVEKGHFFADLVMLEDKNGYHLIWAGHQ